MLRTTCYEDQLPKPHWHIASEASLILLDHIKTSGQVLITDANAAYGSSFEASHASVCDFEQKADSKGSIVIAKRVLRIY